MKDERTMGRLIIQKTDADSNKPLEGVEFVLTAKAAGGEMAKQVTDKEGRQNQRFQKR